MSKMKDLILLGDEAVAQAALDSGISAAYGYPGTPSTEIMEYLLEYAKTHPGITAGWCANEKTSLEGALGTSFAGRRVLVTMKHVGLNVAADPFMNAALLNIKGGVVVVVADDPGMHSSQNEQDSRYYADFARIPCLEPRSQQEAYNMTREAFEISETYHVPVMLRLVTRLSHSRAGIIPAPPRPQNPADKAQDRQNWMLIPALARKRWHHLLSVWKELSEFSEKTRFNFLTQPATPESTRSGAGSLGVITTGLGNNYLYENISEMNPEPAVLHIGFYPWPVDTIRRFVSSVDTVIVLEEGYPFLETHLRGILPPEKTILGKIDGAVPAEGELTPENVRSVLGLPPLEGVSLDASLLSGRPPQLCAGCPHGDSYTAVKEALEQFPDSVVTADIGCYALGVLPPYSVPETIICMGSSIGTAKGASEAGYRHAVAVIGDSTFLHSGLSPLIDAVAAGTSITVLILDNQTVAMTGGQPTVLPSERIPAIVEGIGVDPDHIRLLDAHRKDHDRNVAVFKEEIAFEGPSVIIAVRECIETARKKKKETQGGES
jgi:indolepyruvate ferredoxin oxidoreductase, alpha subunit